MKASLIRSLKIRGIVSKQELSKKVNKFLFINLSSRYARSARAISFLAALKKDYYRISKVRIRNKCAFTNRNNSINNDFSLSRIELRNYIRTGKVYGFKKSAW
jgi:ribosomal protein S14